jgi:hypothetical protein
MDGAANRGICTGIGIGMGMGMGMGIGIGIGRAGHVHGLTWPGRSPTAPLCVPGWEHSGESSRGVSWRAILLYVAWHVMFSARKATLMTSGRARRWIPVEGCCIFSLETRSSHNSLPSPACFTLPDLLTPDKTVAQFTVPNPPPALLIIIHPHSTAQHSTAQHSTATCHPHRAWLPLPRHPLLYTHSS